MAGFVNFLDQLAQGGGALNHSAGTKQAVQDALPQVLFSEETKDQHGSDLPWCPICMEAFSLKDDISFLPCGHYFHRGLQEEGLENRAGVRVKLGTSSIAGVKQYYCSRRLGVQVIPGSSGVCGPNAGPQCPDCQGSTSSSPPTTASGTTTTTLHVRHIYWLWPRILFVASVKSPSRRTYYPLAETAAVPGTHHNSPPARRDCYSQTRRRKAKTTQCLLRRHPELAEGSSPVPCVSTRTGGGRTSSAKEMELSSVLNRDNEPSLSVWLQARRDGRRPHVSFAFRRHRAAVFPVPRGHKGVVINRQHKPRRQG